METVHAANKVGLKTQAFYVFGTLGETKQQMIDTWNIPKESIQHSLFFNMLVPFPGTRYFPIFSKKAIWKMFHGKNLWPSGRNASLTNSDVPAHEIENLIGKANTDYYMHPKRLLNILRHIRTPYEFMSYLVGGIAFMKQIFVWSNHKE